MIKVVCNINNTIVLSILMIIIPKSLIFWFPTIGVSWGFV